ncbi:MAG: DUF5320 domain-containing protein [Lentisphaeria bacterium]|nr:DUF5320 domain-containing protein [Lentisphaeria bacterium]
MPRGDGTGPMGFGPMTGRAAGYCAGYPVPGYMNPVPGRGAWGGGWGRGFGFGRGLGLGFRGGRGRGWGGWWGAAPYTAGAYVPAPYGAAPFAGPTPEQERDGLQGQAEYLEDALEGIRKRIAELEQSKAEKK